MIKQHTHTSKVLSARKMSLGRSCIDVGTLSMDGSVLSPDMTLDDRAGTVHWTATPGSSGPYTFTFDFFRPAEVQVSADKSQIATDGVEQVALTVACEDLTETTITLAVYESGSKVGTFDVTVANGDGQIAKTIAVPGIYEYRVDPDTLDGAWSLPKFTDAGSSIVEAI